MRTLLAIILAAITFAGYSQTPLTNAPLSNLGEEKFGLSTGAVTDGDGVRATIIGDYNINRFFLRGEVQSSQNSSVVSSLGLGGGIQNTWETARVYLVSQFSHSWTKDRFEFSAGGGVAWQPIKDGFLERFSMFIESGIRLGLDGNIGSESPMWENKAGVRYSIRF